MPASVSPVTSVPCEPPSIKERLRALYVTYLNISTSVFCARAFCSTCGGEQGQAVIDQRRVVSHGGRARISVALSVTSHSCHLGHRGRDKIVTRAHCVNTCLALAAVGKAWLDRVDKVNTLPELGHAPSPWSSQ